MKENNFKKRLHMYLLLSLSSLFFGGVIAQNLHIGDGGMFYLSASTDFTTSNATVNQHSNGVFNVEAGITWTETLEDINVHIIGAGTTSVNAGAANQSMITITTASGDSATCDYTVGAPPGGGTTNLGTFELSETEYWTVENTGPSADLSVAGLLEQSGATYDGDVSGGRPTVIVRLDNGDWKLYTSSTGVGTFTLAIDASVLGTEDINAKNFSFYPNPVSANATNINFYLPSSVNQLDITMYDYTGKTIKKYSNVSIQVGLNSVQKPTVSKGLYLIQFSFNNGAEQITKKVVIE